MRFDRSSKIADLWAHPVGHVLLQRFLAAQEQDEAWPDKPLVARLRIASLDKLGTPEQVDRLLEAVNADIAAQQDAEEGVLARRPTWWMGAVVYQIYVPSFMDSDHDGVGDIGGITQRLPYLEQLGVDTLWLCCAGAPGADCTLPDPLALLDGNERAMADMDELLDAAHSRGMRVVAGLNVSHLAQRLNTSPDVPTCSGELDNALRFWKRRGVDGFYFEGLGSDEPSTQAVRHLCLKRLRAEIGSDELLVGGLEGAEPETAAFLTAPLRGELDMVLDTSYLRPPRGFVQVALRHKPGGKAKLGAGNMDLRQLKGYYLRWQQGYGERLWMPLLLETPDLPRIISRVGANPVYRTVLAKMFAVLLFTLRGTPMLFQGEELGLANTRFSSPEEIRDESFRALYGELRHRIGEQQAFDFAQRLAADHARLPMPWSAGAGAGFTGAMPWMRLMDGVEHLNAAYQMQDPASVWSFFRRLIELRRETPALVYGDFKPVFNKNKRLFCYFRIHEGEKWYVEINLTGSETARRGRIAPGQKLVLSNYDTPHRQLRPYEANLYRID